MKRQLTTSVGLSNALTADWVTRGTDGSSFVLSGTGAWMMLAALARGATGDARTELEARVGVEGKDVVRGLHALFELLTSTSDLSAAMGIWTTPKVDILQDYVDAMAPVRVEPVPTDLSVLDTWVISVYLDSPFGFLVVHRSTGLVLFAGWVAEPGGQRTELSTVGSP